MRLHNDDRLYSKSHTVSKWRNTVQKVTQGNTIKTGCTAIHTRFLNEDRLNGKSHEVTQWHSRCARLHIEDRLYSKSHEVTHWRQAVQQVTLLFNHSYKAIYISDMYFMIIGEILQCNLVDQSQIDLNITYFACVDDFKGLRNSRWPTKSLDFALLI